MAKSVYIILLILCSFQLFSVVSCTNKENIIEDTNTDTITNLIIDSTTISSKGIIVDSNNCGVSYRIINGFDNHIIQIEAPNLGTNYQYNGWVIDTNGKLKWADYCGTQWFCKDLILGIPSNKVPPGTYKYRYSYESSGVRFFSSALTLTVY